MVAGSDKRYSDKVSAPKPLSLRGARKLVGLSQQQLAAQLGIRQQHYSDLERGFPLTPAEHLTILQVLRDAGLAGLTASDLACLVASESGDAP